MMHGVFYWGKDVTLLFDFWDIKTWTWYAISLLVVFLFSVLHEWLGGVKSALSGKVEEPVASPLEEDRNHWMLSISHTYRKQKSHVYKKAKKMVLFGIHVGLNFLLMLAAMSFNGGVILTIIAGLTFGHVMFKTEGKPSDSKDGRTSTLEKKKNCADVEKKKSRADVEMQHLIGAERSGAEE